MDDKVYYKKSNNYKYTKNFKEKWIRYYYAKLVNFTINTQDIKDYVNIILNLL